MLHQYTQKLDLGEKKGRHIFTEIERFENLSKECQKRFSDYGEAASHIAQFSEEAREKIKDKKLLSGVIHNDYRIQNLIFQSDADCSIIDFDWACYGPLIKDVALAVGEWSYFDIKTGPSREAIDQFLKGYNETAPKPIEYSPELIFWICFAYLSETSNFLSDTCEGRHDSLNITRVEQCRSYRKFKFFFSKKSFN